MSTWIVCAASWLIVWVAVDVLNAMHLDSTPWLMRSVWLTVALLACWTGLQPPHVPMHAALLLLLMAGLAVRFRRRLVFEAATEGA